MFLWKSVEITSPCLTPQLTSLPQSDEFTLDTNSRRKPSNSLPSMYPLPEKHQRDIDNL